MRKLIVLSDGTGNSSAKAQKTNVWRMFQAIDQSTSEQLAIYDDGVGSSANTYLAAIGGAFGWGLERNVLDLYKFLCRNHTADDEIFGFGFSRGAYTIRVLAALVLSEGLVNFNSEEELQRKAKIAYNAFRARCFRPAPGPVMLGRLVRDGVNRLLDKVLGRTPYSAANNRCGLRIRFLGLWDTVGAYAVPIEELKPVINYLIWPMMFDNLILSPKVDRACHALALDDERTTFHPIVWDEHEEEAMAERGEVARGRLTQLWFAGVHSNLGGGYPEDQLALVSLDWMMSQAAACGLRLQGEDVARVSQGKSAFARMYDSRDGAGVLYRYSPRQIRVRKERLGKVIKPLVHGSVVMRMANGSDRYAPLSLPEEFLVLAPDGSMIPMRGGAARLRADQDFRVRAPAPQVVDFGVADRATAELHAAVERLSGADAQAVALVLDTIWWRRLVYLSTVALAVWLLLFPFVGKRIHQAITDVMNALPLVGNTFKLYYDSVATLDSGVGPLLGPLVNTFNALIPDMLHRWTLVLKESPIEFVGLAVLLLLSVSANFVLRTRIRDRSMLAWHRELKSDYLAWMEDHEGAARRFGFVVALVAALFAAGAIRSAQPLRFELGALACLLGGFAAWRIWRAHTTLAKLRNNADTQLPSTLALRFARRLRSNAPLVQAYRILSKKVIPAVLGVLFAAAILLLANRVLFDVANAAGAYCERSSPLAPFSTSNACWASGIALEAGQRYRITIDTPGDWTDLAIPTDPGGFAAKELKHKLASPLKRWWSEDWFTPIARVGRGGNEEYALHPAQAYPLRPPCRAGCVTPDANFSPISDAKAAAIMQRCPTPEARTTLSTEFTAQGKGELYVYVNDAVFFWNSGFFYRNNRGSATISVEKLPPKP